MHRLLPAHPSNARSELEHTRGQSGEFSLFVTMVDETSSTQLTDSPFAVPKQQTLWR